MTGHVFPRLGAQRSVAGMQGHGRRRAACMCAWIALFFGAARTGTAQDVPEFNTIRTPTSPAFVVLGIAPSHVDRPTTPSAIAVSFLERIGEGATLLPGSFALESAPYWWRSHPALTLEAYRDAGTVERLLRNATVSLGVTDSVPHRPAGAETDAAYRRLGIGLRTTLVPGRQHDPPCITALNRWAAQASAEVGGVIAQMLVADPTLADRPDSLETLRAAAFAQRSQEIEATAAACTEQIAATTGFVLDGAIGAAFDFAGGRAANGRPGAFGLWLTPSWLGRTATAAGVLRLTRDALRTDASLTAFDVGVRGIHASERWSLSAESVYRRLERGDTADDLFRVTVLADVLLAGETWLTVSFGKDFDGDEAGSLLALANLQWNVGGRGARPRLVR